MELRGIDSRKKSLKMTNQLNNLPAYTVFLQETHMTKTHLFIFPSHILSLLLKTKRFSHIKLQENELLAGGPQGRLIILYLYIQNMDLCITSIYGPNVDDPSFVYTFFFHSQSHPTLFIKHLITASTGPKYGK